MREGGGGGVGGGRGCQGQILCVLPYAADIADNSDDTWGPSYLEDQSVIALGLQFHSLYKSIVLKRLL